MYIYNSKYSKKTNDFANEVIQLYLEDFRIESLQNRKRNDRISNIYVIAELWEHLEEKELWLETILSLLKEMNGRIAEEYYGIGSFSGLTALAQALYYLNQKTGQFSGVKKQIDSELFSITNAVIPHFYSTIDSIFVRYYDTISGLSGVLNYISNLEESEARSVLVEKILGFFSDLFDYQTIHESTVPRWFVRAENLTHFNKEAYPDGNLNFSMSHGMIGPIAAVCKLYKRGYRSVLIERIMQAAIPYYEKYRFRGTDGALYWPGYLPLSSYDTSVCITDLILVPSWCYGNWSVGWTLLSAYQLLGNQKRSDEMKQHLNTVCRKQYDYKTPVVCHGYAGNLIMLLKFQERLGDMTTEIENTAEKLRKYYDPDLANMFAELEDADSILGGCGGVVLSLICLLKNKAHVFDILMLNS